MGPLFLFRIKKKKTLKGQRQQLLKIRGGGKRPRSSSGNIRSIGGWRNRLCTSDDDIVGENKAKRKSREREREREGKQREQHCTNMHYVYVSIHT